VDDLEQGACDEEEDSEEEDIGNRARGPPTHDAERVEHVPEQLVPGGACPGEEGEHVLQIDEREDEDRDHAGPDERSPQG
jgi:hypothetical protein